ncbi:histidine kinase [Sinomonas cyclohexanicum]|uniref:histidine kinase n=1 Tax=Sinomonas cyclohexanicum TaxID=322009 RepID=A0ABN6FGY7_SINCY|nr:sensor histidine kinase [Corynebacterium cyclohexanicum]BCT75879.1 histidine kinase [Corynebacterium cyclohexanicum]
MRPLSLATRMLWILVLAVLMLTAFIGTAMYVDARDQSHDQAAKRTLAVASAIADNPFAVDAARRAAAVDPTAALQPYALQVTKDASLDFITIMAPDRTRWTHVNPEQIGGKYIGSVDEALAGHPFTEETAGTLGPSVRTIVPIVDGGKVIGMVAAGVTVSAIEVAIAGRLPALVAIAAVVLALGSLGALAVGRYLSRVTRGYGPEQLGQLFAYYESVLHSVREGVILVDGKGQVVIRNDQASRLLGLPEDDLEEARGYVLRPAPLARNPLPTLRELGIPGSLRELLTSGRTAHDEIHLTGDRVLVVNQEPAVSHEGRRERVLGAVATLRDRTEIEALGTELETMRTLSDALRSQTHEHANRLHTIVSLLELGQTDRALAFATDDLRLSQSLADELVVSVDEPVLAALIMGKAAQANERGVRLDAEATASIAGSGLDATDLVTIVGNLIDNAIDAAAAAEAPAGDARRWVSLEIVDHGDTVVIEVADSGPGVPEAETEQVLTYGYSTKPHTGHGRGLGLALVKRSVERLCGTLTVSRRDGAVFTVVVPRREQSA